MSQSLIQVWRVPALSPEARALLTGVLESGLAQDCKFPVSSGASKGTPPAPSSAPRQFNTVYGNALALSLFGIASNIQPGEVAQLCV